MNRKTLKTLIGAVLALFLLTLVYWWLNREDDAAGLAPGRSGGEAAVAVEVAPVQRGGIAARRTFTGTLQPVSRFDVAARVGGRLLKLYVDLGDTVRRGQVVARLDSDEYRLEVDKARAELAVTKAGLAEAESALATSRREYERAQSLRRQGVASEAELDGALANYEAQQAKAQVAAAQVSQRRAALAATELRLSYTEIRADWQGGEPERVIAERLVDEGSLLAANTPLFSLVGIDRLVAVAHAPERDYPLLRPGQAVTVRADAVAGRSFAGELARLAPVVREASRQARLEVELANPEQVLKPGMFVRLEIEVARQDNALLVPRAALVERPGEYAVFQVHEDGKSVRYVPVELGLQSREMVEILAPEISGRVVTMGQYLLSDGARIIIPKPVEPDAGPGERS